VPLFIVDKKSGKLGLIHAGWRGLAKGIVENGINQFNNKEDIFIGIGPHICRKCYAVDEPVSGKFPESCSDGHLDLTCEIKLRLSRQCGIREKNIHACNDCTYHDRDKFYSYRRGDLNSRMISVMIL
jgi:copper oxidase (laccase) domain-containing protein